MRGLVIFLVLSIAAPAWAGPPACVRAETLRYSDVVSCSEGILLPPAWALACTRLKTVTVPGLEADLRLTKTALSAKTEALTAELVLERRFSARQGKLLDRALGTHKQPVWWSRPSVLVAFGVAIGTVMTVGVTYAVNDGQ